MANTSHSSVRLLNDHHCPQLYRQTEELRNWWQRIVFPPIIPVHSSSLPLKLFTKHQTALSFMDSCLRAKVDQRRSRRSFMSMEVRPVRCFSDGTIPTTTLTPTPRISTLPVAVTSSFQ